MPMYIRPLRPDELYHHGIPGMHWGVRRYQNEDGSLTSKGLKRQRELLKSSKESKAASKVAVKSLIKENRKYKRGIKRAARGLKSSSYAKKNESAKRIEDLLVKKKLNEVTISAIKNGDIKAGKDFITTKSKMKVPVAYVGLTGPKMKLLNVDKSKLVIDDKTKLKALNTARSKMSNSEQEEELKRRTGDSIYEARLSKEIEKRSGDYYYSKPITKSFERTANKIRKANANGDWDGRRKAKDELAGVVLKDLGYRNNKKNREAIYDTIFWD